jgi:membrane protein DedA with SNARE-associated domain
VDESLTTILGAVLVALVGCLVGFYFGRRIEEETQLNEHRHKALDRMSAQGW